MIRYFLFLLISINTMAYDLAPRDSIQHRFKVLDSYSFTSLTVFEKLNIKNLNPKLYKELQPQKESIDKVYSLRSQYEIDHNEYNNNKSLSDSVKTKLYTYQINETAKEYKAMPFPQLVFTSSYTHAAIITSIVATKGKAPDMISSALPVPILNIRELLPEKMRVLAYTPSEDIKTSMYYGSRNDTAILEFDRFYYGFRPTVNYGIFATNDQLGLGVNKNFFTIETNFTYRPYTKTITTNESKSIYKGYGEAVYKMEQYYNTKEYRYGVEYRYGF